MAVHVLTKDLVGTLRYKHRIVFSVKMENEIYHLQNQFVENLLEGILDPSSITVIDEEDLQRTVNDFLRSVATPVLSCDDVFGRSSGNSFVHDLELSRVMHSFKERLFSVSARPNFPNTEDQLLDLKEKLHRLNQGLDVIIYDLGIYGGRLVGYVVENAIRFGFNVAKVVTCITRKSGKERIENKFRDVDFPIETLKLEFDGGWDELRDIIGLHGFLVESSNARNEEREEIENGNFFIPYEEIIPWFSLPFKAVEKFKDICGFYRCQLNSLFIKEQIPVTIRSVGHHEDLLVYALKRLF